MASVSWFLLFVLSAVYQTVDCVPQVALASITEPAQFLQSAAPDLAGPASSAASCGGCHIVADVAGLVWYSEVFINTAATALVSVGSANGTQATRTSVVQNEGQFTFDPNAATASGGALTQLNFAPTVDVGGALLTSPTAYNVFTAYSITSAFLSNGVCVTNSGSASKLPEAYSETLTSANGKVTLDANGQQQFINQLGFSSCSGGGINIVPTALVQITNSTVTTSATFSNVPLAAAVASITIAPQSTPSSAHPGVTTSVASASSTSFPAVNAPLIVVNNQTLTPTPNPLGLQTYNGTFSPTATSTSTGSAGSAVVVLGTGPSGRNVTATSPVAFTGGVSSRWQGGDSWLTLWGVGMLSLVALMYYL